MYPNTFRSHARRQVALSTASDRPAGWRRRCSPGCRSRPASAATCAPPRRPRGRRRSPRTFTCRRARIAAAAASSAAGVARDQDHVAALVGQHLGRGAPDALRAAGDQRALACQLQIHALRRLPCPAGALPIGPARGAERAEHRQARACSSRKPHSGCHCTPQAKPLAVATRTASMVPSSAQRLHHQAGRRAARSPGRAASSP